MKGGERMTHELTDQEFFGRARKKATELGAISSIGTAMSALQGRKPQETPEEAVVRILRKIPSPQAEAA